MEFDSINWFAVIACVIVSMISGAIWYSPKVFFKVWWKGIGKSEEDTQMGSGSMGKTWGLTILASFVQAVFMSLAVAAVGEGAPGGPTLALGAGVGAVLWLGFVAPTSLVNKLFAGSGLTVWSIEAGDHLLNFVLFGAILGAWR